MTEAQAALLQSRIGDAHALLEEGVRITNRPAYELESGPAAIVDAIVGLTRVMAAIATVSLADLEVLAARELDTPPAEVRPDWRYVSVNGGAE